MNKLLSKQVYEDQIAKTRDQRMEWWRKARYGMFVHYGLYSTVGRHEWLMTQENIPIEEYESLANDFKPKKNAPQEWAKLAKQSGMKYMVMTTRHHEGFSLWDSKANPYNSVNYGPKRDIVKEFVQACRDHDLKIGFYTSLMDWHHPDSWKCAFDSKARKRFLDYITELNTELLTQYGKIDILWYDVSRPMESHEGWNALEMNQKMRSIQPHLIINNRSGLDEDFSTPEENIKASKNDWEACMTFNGISWGYVDSEQAKPYSYNANRIVRMLNTCCKGGGNLLLNIGPTPDGSVPQEAIGPLMQVGKWLKENKEGIYTPAHRIPHGGNGVTGSSASENKVYLWSWIWPKNGQMALGGYLKPPKAIRFVKTGKSIDFEFNDQRVILKNLPDKPVDDLLGITMMVMEFEDTPEFVFASAYPQLNGGRQYL